MKEVLFGHPAESGAAVLGIPDPVKGEVVPACVVLRQGQMVTGTERMELRRERIATYKVPAVVGILTALSKSPTGKILKKDLRGGMR